MPHPLSLPLPLPLPTPTQVKSLLRENVCADAADAARLMLVLPLLAIPELKLLFGLQLALTRLALTCGDATSLRCLFPVGRTSLIQ